MSFLLENIFKISAYKHTGGLQHKINFNLTLIIINMDRMKNV